MVREYWHERTGWKWEVLANLLQPTTLLKVVSMVIDLGIEGVDQMGKLDPNRGKFSVKSTYELQVGGDGEGNWEGGG